MEVFHYNVTRHSKKSSSNGCPYEVRCHWRQTCPFFIILIVLSLSLFALCSVSYIKEGMLIQMCQLDNVAKLRTGKTIF